MIEYNANANAAEAKEERMRQRFRNVFGSEEGKRVLGEILRRNHFGVPLNNEVERIEYNVGVEIARMSGIMGAIDSQLRIGED
jgi:hypothetical protein